MLVSLSYLTGYDWEPLFDVVGLRNTDMALAQAKKNGKKGKIAKGLFMLNENTQWQMPMAILPFTMR